MELAICGHLPVAKFKFGTKTLFVDYHNTGCLADALLVAAHETDDAPAAAEAVEQATAARVASCATAAAATPTRVVGGDPETGGGSQTDGWDDAKGDAAWRHLRYAARPFAAGVVPGTVNFVVSEAAVGPTHGARPFAVKVVPGTIALQHVVVSKATVSSTQGRTAADAETEACRPMHEFA